MPDGKKDVLEFPLEELEVPQAIVLMMQAAAARPTISTWCDEQENSGFEVDNERLQQLAEKLEARVEDAIDAAKAVREDATAEDAPNEPLYSDVEGHTVTLVEEYIDHAGVNVITKVVVDRTVYGLLCNRGVFDNGGIQTTCIKRFDHQSLIHEDEFGNEAR